MLTITVSSREPLKGHELGVAQSLLFSWDEEACGPAGEEGATGLYLLWGSSSSSLRNQKCCQRERSGLASVQMWNQVADKTG